MFGYLVLLLGLAYGYMTPGRQNKWDLFKTAVLIGIVLGVLLALLGMFAGVNALGLAGFGLVEIVVSAIVIALIFVVGAWLGDLLEARMKPRRT